jgi:hypothetical protein
VITPSSAFTTANAKLAKQPVFLIEVEGYSRAFATKGGAATINGVVSDFVLQKASRANIGGIGAPGDVTLPSATPAGNILLAFLSQGDGGPTPGISDTAGNTWVPICTRVNTLGISFPVTIWRAVALAAAAGNVVTFTTGGSRVSSDFIVIELAAQFSGSLFAHTSGAGGTAYASAPTATTSDGNTLTIPLTSGVSAKDLFMVSLSAASGVSPAVAVGFVIAATGTGGSLVDSSQLIQTAGGTTLAGSATTSAVEWASASDAIDDLKETVSDLDGSSDLSNLTFTVQDRGQQLTADLANFTFEGKIARLKHGFVGMDVADYLTMFTGQIDSVDSANGNLEYQFTVSSVNLKKLTQKIYLTGDDGFGISSNHPKTLFDHPLNILVDALQQAGIDLADIDTDKIEYYRDTIFSGTPFKFSLTSAPTAKEFIEGEIMRPLAMYLRVNNVGMVTINSFYPAVSGNGTYTPPTPPVMTAVVSTNRPDVNQLDAPLAQEAALVNQVVFKFDAGSSGSSDFLAEQVVDLDASIAKYGLVGSRTIESQGMKSGFQGYFQSALDGRLISLRYGFKNLVFDPLPLTWNACVVEPGDIIAVTNPFVPDRVAGVLGISNMFFEVLDRNWRFKEGVVEVKLLAIDFSLFKQYKIAPNAEADYAAASTPDKAQYMFQCSAAGKYSTGANANTLG